MDYLLEDFLDLGITKPVKKSFKHALTDVTRERFGIFVFSDNNYDYNFIPFDNLDKKNPNHFTVDNSKFLKFYLNKKIISLFHTHIETDVNPSEQDIAIAESLGLPSYIFSTKNKESFLYYPENYKPVDLHDRIFIPFFQDCVSFVKDFYFLNFKLNFNTLVKDWSRSRINSNDKLINSIINHFNEVDKNYLKYGDLILFKPEISNLYHLGVIDQDNLLSHHPIGSKPTRNLFNDKMSNKVYKCYRYKDL